MGISDLNKVIKENAPNSIRYVSLVNYTYKKIGIDISLYLYKYKASQGNRWIDAFLNLIMCLRKFHVHCVFIYDGPSPPEKYEEQKKRKSSTQAQREKIERLQKELDLFKSEDIYGSTIKETYEKQAKNLPLLRPSIQESVDKMDVIKVIEENIEHRQGMIISITEEDTQLTKDLFTVLEIPFLTAPDEAERYASQLCVNGVIDAVLSEDTDVMVYGTPVFLSNINIYNGTVCEIFSDILLEEMDMTLSTFRDMCILLGCDYNSNIPSYGVKSVYKLIVEHKSIEKILEEIEKKVPSVDSSCLKYQRCRELFSVDTNKTYPKIGYCGSPDFNKVKEFFFIKGISYDVNKLIKYMKPREDIEIYE